MHRIVALSFFVAGCGGSPGPAPPGERTEALTVLYQGRLDGEIEPCG